MALINITGSTARITTALTRLEQLGRQPQEFLRALGQQQIERTQTRIRQGVTPDGTPFAPLNPLYAASKPSGVGILQSTGNLRNHLTTALHGNTLLWGSNLDYAAVHQFGAVIRRRRAPALVFSIGGTWFRKQFVTIPGRPYLGFNSDDRAAAVDTLETFFRGCLRG